MHNKAEGKMPYKEFNKMNPELPMSQLSTNYLETIFAISAKYLDKVLSREEQQILKSRCHYLTDRPTTQIVKGFLDAYRQMIKQQHQREYKSANQQLDAFLHTPNKNIKVVWGNCLDALNAMHSESVHLMVTSPPYYNARQYSQWGNLNAYLQDMSEIIKAAYRVLDNHRAFVFNVGDITGNDHAHTKSSWGDRRIPLGAYFINIFEKAGFTFVDDFIWDKGEVQSQRHKNGDTPNPMYQYPLNCYEHIMVFLKHRKDETIYPCPVCGCLKVNGNAYCGVGVKSWECKNLKCFERSKSNRGKRFSLRSIMMDELKNNMIDPEFIKKWRRDIVRMNPTIKINSKGENIIGHTAPFPHELAEFAIKFFSGIGESVLDPFAGSFTTAIEAARNERNGIGIELNKEMFYNAIVKNIKKCLFNYEEYDLNKKHKIQGHQENNRAIRRDAVGNGIAQKGMASI